MIKYNLTDQNMVTCNDFKWEIGVWKEAARGFPEVGTRTVLHFYDSPEIAAIIGPVLTTISNPRLWECEIDDIVAHDGVMGGAKKMRLVKEIAIPNITTQMCVDLALACVRSIYGDSAVREWQATRFKEASDSALRFRAIANIIWMAWESGYYKNWLADIVNETFKDLKGKENEENKTA